MTGFGIRSGGGLFIESVRRRLVRTPVEVPIDVEEGLHAGVAEAVGDHFGVLTLGDERSHVGVAKDMSAQAVLEPSPWPAPRGRAGGSLT